MGAKEASEEGKEKCSLTEKRPTNRKGHLEEEETRESKRREGNAIHQNGGKKSSGYLKIHWDSEPILGRGLGISLDAKKRMSTIQSEEEKGRCEKGKKKASPFSIIKKMTREERRKRIYDPSQGGERGNEKEKREKGP